MTSTSQRPRTAAYPLVVTEVTLATLAPSGGGDPVPMARLKDVATVLNVSGEDLAAAASTALTTSDAAATLDGQPFVTLAAARRLAKVAPDPVAAARFTAWLGRRLAVKRADPGTTRWGWQPLRSIMKERHLGVAALADLLNATPVTATAPVTRGNVGGSVVGATLPKEETLARLTAALGCQPEEMFTPAVIEAIDKRRTRLLQLTKMDVVMAREAARLEEG